MAATLKLTAASTAELDLSTYLNVQEDGGLDPADGGFLAPSFNDSSIGAGQGLVSIDTSNKEQVYPLMLKAASKDALHALVQTVRRKLDEPGVRVEWKDHSATLSTFYDLEYGRIEPAYRYFRARQNWMGASLHLWTRPYGHTATERIVGTAVGSSFMTVFSLASVLGDVPALISLAASGASGIVIDRWGMSIVPSGVLVEYGAASLVTTAATNILTGGSGAAGSQYRAIYSSTSDANLCRADVTFMASRVGDQRILALARTSNLGGAYIRAINGPNPGASSVAFGPTAFVGATNPLAPSAIAVGSAWSGWQLYDLGVIRYISPSARDNLNNYNITIRGSLNGASIMASPALHVNALYIVPEARTILTADTTRQMTIPLVVVDGLIGETYAPGGYSFVPYQRGIPPTVGPSEQVVGFAVGAVANTASAWGLRVRERFSFQR
jgi:hypothetical protein